MEISGLSPYLIANVTGEPDNQVSAGQKSDDHQGSASVPETDARDRVELVQGQNLASPVTEQVNIKRAAILLRQVMQQLSVMDRQAVRGLYRFDRLRDLCLRLQEGVEA